MDKYICINPNFNNISNVKLCKGQNVFVDNDGYIIDKQGNKLCYKLSDNGLRNFVYNSDNNGKQRYELSKQFLHKFIMTPYLKRCKYIDTLIDDNRANYYNSEDENSWNLDRKKFSIASISDLKYLVSIVEKWN